MNDFLKVDWSKIPSPIDDGAADHLTGKKLPSVLLPSTNGDTIDLSALTGLTVLYIYPRTGSPNVPSYEGWSMIPGAQGCTPQSCAFRDHFDELRGLGVAHLFGLSTQDTAYQKEATERLHLPFPLLSDEQFLFADALKLPMFHVNDVALLKRLTMVIQDGGIVHALHPVFPPDQNATDVMRWISNHKIL